MQFIDPLVQNSLKMSNRRITNKVSKLDVNGKEVEGSHLVNSAIDYFKKLFNKNMNAEFPEIICKNIISEYGANFLNAELTAEEIK